MPHEWWWWWCFCCCGQTASVGGICCLGSQAVVEAAAAVVVSVIVAGNPNDFYGFVLQFRARPNTAALCNQVIERSQRVQRRPVFSFFLAFFEVQTTADPCLDRCLCRLGVSDARSCCVTCSFGGGLLIGQGDPLVRECLGKPLRDGCCRPAFHFVDLYLVAFVHVEVPHIGIRLT